MTLWISVYIEDENGETQFLEFDRESGGNSHLGGFEVSRYKFWGHPVMTELGLKLLPLLGKGYDIVIEDVEHLSELEKEANVILQNKATILEATQHNEDFLVFHTENILYAIDKARSIGGIFSMG